MFTNLPASHPKTDYDEEFATFWSHYPLRKGKQPARVAFEKARKGGVTLEKLCEAADRYAQEVRGRDPSRIKWAQGWLNDKRWQDYDEPQPHINGNDTPWSDYVNAGRQGDAPWNN